MLKTLLTRFLARKLERAITAGVPIKASLRIADQPFRCLELSLQAEPGVSAANITSFSFDREMAETLGIKEPDGFTVMQLYKPDYRDFEPDLSELQGMPTEAEIEQLKASQFQQEVALAAELSGKRVVYSGLLVIQAGPPVTLRFPVSGLPDKAVTIAVGYEHRVGALKVQSSTNVTLAGVSPLERLM